MLSLEMIQTRGYSAFSYQDLSERLHIKKASIHYHFPTKEQLGIFLMESGYARFQDWRGQIGKKKLPFMSQIESFFDYFAQISSKGTRICPCSALSSEWDALPEKLKSATTKLVAGYRDWIKAALRGGREAGEISTDGTVEEQTLFLFAAIQGALQIARTQNDLGCFRAVVRQIRRALEA